MFPPTPPPTQEASVVSPGPETLFLAQGHTARGDRASPPSGSRSPQVTTQHEAQAGWVGPAALCQHQGQGPSGDGVEQIPQGESGRRQVLEGKGPGKPSSGGCCHGNQARTKS